MVRLPRNKKQTCRLNTRPQMWPSGLTLAMTLTLNFQGQIWNLLYLSQKLSDCHEMKSKHIDWTLGFKCDHQVWPWPWPWPWIFKVKFDLDLWSHTWPWPWIAVSQNGRADWHWTKGWELAMTMTIWWPRSGVRIYQIVTGVTSDVGVLSTRLVIYANTSKQLLGFISFVAVLMALIYRLPD